MTNLPTEPIKFAHYEVISKLGQGAMGVVYLARDERIGRRVALKIVRPQKIENVDEAKEFFARLQREAELSGSLNHPNIATLYEVGYENRLISYLAMEHVEGETVYALVRRDEPIAVDTALAIVEDVLEGLAYAHSCGVIHRDIKPANIIVRADGRAKILDFGIARGEDSSLTMSGSFVGTPNYMSPEQVKSEAITPRVDLFSLGVVLFEMLTSTKPFAADSLTAVVYNVVEKALPPLQSLRPEVPLAVDAFLQRLVAKKPDDRFANAAEALAALRRVRREAVEPISTPFEPFPEAIEVSDEEMTEPDLPRLAPPVSLFRRRIPGTVAPLVVAFLLAPLLIWSGILIREAATRPLLRRTALQVAEAKQKRATLDRGAALLAANKNEEAEALYSEYLQRYPSSVPARDSLDKIVAAKQPTMVVSVEEKHQKKTPKASEAKPSTMSRIKSRMKSIFHRN